MTSRSSAPSLDFGEREVAQSVERASEKREAAGSTPALPAFVELKGGLLITARALTLALDLETRGHALTAKDGTLFVSNGSALTTEDRRQIQADRFHLLAIAGLNETPA